MLYLPEIASHTFPERITRYTRLAQNGWAVILEGAKEVILLDGKLNETNRINIEKWHPVGYKYSYWMDLNVSPDAQYLVLSAKDQVIVLDQQGQLLHRTQYAEKELDDHIQFIFTQDGLIWSVTRTSDHQSGHVLTLMELPSARVITQYTIDTHRSICYLCPHPFATEVLAIISDHCAIDEGSQIYRVEWDGVTLSLVDYGLDDWAVYTVAPTGDEFVCFSRHGSVLSFHDFRTGNVKRDCKIHNLFYETSEKEPELYFDHLRYLSSERCLIRIERHQQNEYWLLDRANLYLLEQVSSVRNLPTIEKIRHLWLQNHPRIREPLLFGISKGAPGELLFYWSDNTLQLVDSRQLLHPNLAYTTEPSIQNYQLTLFDYEN